LTQDLQRTRDIEQQQAWWNDDEYRDAANILETIFDRAGKCSVKSGHGSGFV
jgi:hypothetical protein